MWSDWHIRLKAAAKAKGKTDALLADELQAYGIEAGRAAVNHWLNNKRPIALNAFFAICELLEVDPAEILFEISAYTSHSLRPGVQAAIAYEALPAEDRPAARRVLKMPETETARRPKKGGCGTSAASPSDSKGAVIYRFPSAQRNPEDRC